MDFQHDAKKCCKKQKKEGQLWKKAETAVSA